ncbi:MAG: response regulator [Elusimicrobia bacterium]|nr:response regulator [Elusimicrobiota bacterium]
MLAVDDDADVLAVIRATLGAAGHRVAEASSAPEAARLLAAAPRYPDLLILDLVMPRLDGLTLAARLRLDPRTRALPILFVSGRGDLSAVFGGARNVRGGLRKPFEPRELVDAVEAALTGPAWSR